MPIGRRDFIRQTAAAAAGAVAGIPLPGSRRRRPPSGDAGLKWSQGALPLLRHRLRRDGGGQGQPRGRHARRPAGRGQPRPQLRQGLLPLEDHVRRGPADDAAAAHEGRQVRQGRRVRAASPGTQAFDVMAEQFKRVLKEKGPTAVGMFGSGQWTVWEGYAGLKLMKAGFRSNNLDPNARHCMASAAVGLHAHLRHRRADGLLRRHRGRRRLRALGLEHGRDAPDPVDAGDRPAPERAERQGGGAVDLRAPLLRAGRHRAHLHAADRPGDPQLHRPPHHQDQPREPRLRRQAHDLPARQRRHRLRPAARASAAEGGEERRRRRRRRSR